MGKVTGSKMVKCRNTHKMHFHEINILAGILVMTPKSIALDTTRYFHRLLKIIHTKSIILLKKLLLSMCVNSV